MRDRRRTASYAVIASFMAVTVAHVAIYAGSFEREGWQAVGWFYALAVDAAIALSAWLTRWKTTARWAWICYFTFITASGTLNMAYVKPWEYELFAWVYALFPTAAQALLGFLARDADLLAERSNRSKGERTTVQRPVPALSEQGNGHKPAECPWCGRTFATTNACNAHQRFCKERERKLITDFQEQS